MPKTCVRWVLVSLVASCLAGHTYASTPVRLVAMEYPDLARRAKIQGSAKVKCLVGIDGTVQHVEMISGHILFRKALEQNLHKWRFTRGSEEYVLVDFSFTLQGSNCQSEKCSSVWSFDYPSQVTIVGELPEIQPHGPAETVPTQTRSPHRAN